MARRFVIRHHLFRYLILFSHTNAIVSAVDIVMQPTQCIPSVDAKEVEYTNIQLLWSMRIFRW